jgi:hypothetical protein
MGQVSGYYLLVWMEQIVRFLPAVSDVWSTQVSDARAEVHHCFACFFSPDLLLPELCPCGQCPLLLSGGWTNLSTCGTVLWLTLTSIARPDFLVRSQGTFPCTLVENCLLSAYSSSLPQTCYYQPGKKEKWDEMRKWDNDAITRSYL